MPDNDTTTKSADEEPFTPTPEKSSSKTKESEGGKVGDCLYTAVNHAIGNADANEDAFRRLATEWLVNADQDIHGRIADYGGIDAIINVVSTPQAWTGDEGDLAPYVLALALDIQLNIHVAGRNAPYPFNVGGARIVDVYYYANHYTHTPTSHHRKKKRKKTTSIPKEITPVESISKTVSEMSIPEEIPDAYANIREQLRELETAISELSDDKAVSLRERIRRAIGMEDPRKAFLRLSGEVENYIQSKSKPQNKTTENPPLKSPETEPEITFTTGYKGGSVTKQKLGGGNKKGTFVGNMKGIHIHIVGDNTHLQIGGHQYKIRRISYKKNCEDALRALIHRNNRSLPGYNDCLRWLCNELDIDHTRFL